MLFFGYPNPPWWQHAKTRCVFLIYAIICISGNTQIFKIKIFNHQNIVLFYIQTTAFQCGGGGGCLFFSPLCSRVITESPYTPQIKEPQTYPSWKHTENYPKAYTCISYFNQLGRNFGQLFEKCPNTWSYFADRPKLAEILARSIETPNMITEMGTYDSRHEQGTQEQ